MLHRIFVFVILSGFALVLSFGCNGIGTSQIDIPIELNGDWRLTGSMISQDQTIHIDYDEQISIDDGKVFLSGGRELAATFIKPYLHIVIDMVVEDKTYLDRGRVVTTAKATLMPFVISEENEYDGGIVGVFQIHSETEGDSVKQIAGDVKMKRS
jgi:hypothetical protein